MPMYSSRDGYDVVPIVIGIVLFVGFIMGVFALANASERSKCESLRSQGIKAFIADSLFGQECIVIERVVAPKE